MSVADTFTFDAVHHRIVCKRCGWLTKFPRVMSRATADKLIRHRSVC